MHTVIVAEVLQSIHSLNQSLIHYYCALDCSRLLRLRDVDKSVATAADAAADEADDDDDASCAATEISVVFRFLLPAPAPASVHVFVDSDALAALISPLTRLMILLLVEILELISVPRLSPAAAAAAAALTRLLFNGDDDDDDAAAAHAPRSAYFSG